MLYVESTLKFFQFFHSIKQENIGFKLFRGKRNQSAQSPMFGNDWNNYFKDKYGQENVSWKPKYFDDIIQDPRRLYGATQSEIAQILGEGWTASSYDKSGTVKLVGPDYVPKVGDRAKIIDMGY
ncbi:hypothetical protein LJC58_09580 [Lachnospiraceae bacterium OttesenSCG-928-D06]|nr:hypothetical protein [Lachnospiraceae bacterium OttesenSCG-928-D06]